MIPQDILRALATTLRYDGDPLDSKAFLAHAADIMENRSAAWRHFDAEVRRRCRVQGRLKAARRR